MLRCYLIRVDRLDKKRPRESLDRFLHGAKRPMNTTIRERSKIMRNYRSTRSFLREKLEHNQNDERLCIEQLDLDCYRRFEAQLGNVTICEQGRIEHRQPRLREKNEN